MSFGSGVSEKDAIQNLQNTAGDVMGTAGDLAHRSDKIQGRSKEAFKFFKKSGGEAMNYWRDILSGDRNALAEFLGPEASAISESYAQPLATLSEQGPRGGGTASAVGGLQSAEARSMGDLFMKARPEAARNLGSLAGMFGGVSGELSGQGLSGLNQAGNLQIGAGGLESDALKAISAGRERTSKFWGDIGSTAGQVAGSFLFPPGAASKCCFIFLEALNGPLPWFVRECRDEYYILYPSVAKGYVRMAHYLVPLMKKYNWIKKLVNRWMVKPIISYGAFLKNVKGGKKENKIYKDFWFFVWKVLGR